MKFLLTTLLISLVNLFPSGTRVIDDFNDNDKSGILLQFATYSESNGNLTGISDGTGAPRITMNDTNTRTNLGFKPGQYLKIELTLSNAPGSGTGLNLYYFRDGVVFDPPFTRTRLDDGLWHTYTWFVGTSSWSNCQRITGFRIDPIGTTATAGHKFSIDSLKVFRASSNEIDEFEDNNTEQIQFGSGISGYKSNGIFYGNVTVAGAQMRWGANGGAPILTNINATLFPRIEIRMKTPVTTGGSQMRLYWWWVGGGPANVISTIVSDGEWHTYQIDLSANSSWTNKIIRAITLIPMNAGTGNFQMDYIRPLPPNPISIALSGSLAVRKNIPAVFSASALSTTGTITNYEWDFGTGEKSNGDSLTNLKYTFTNSGVFNVTLTVRNDLGDAVSKSLSVTSAVPTIVAHYPFDDTNGTFATNIVGGSATILSGDDANWQPEKGTKAGCLFLNGTSNAILAPPVEGVSFTLSMWLYITTTHNGTLFTQRTGGNQFTLVLNGNGSLSFSAWGSTGVLLNSTTPVNLIVPGGWYQVAITISTSLCSLYINGKQIIAAEITGPINTGATSFIIGKHYSLQNTYLSGYVDDLRIYNLDLFATEVAEIYSNGIPFKKEIHHWKLDETAGTKASNFLNSNYAVFYGENSGRFNTKGVSNSAIYFNRMSSNYLKTSQPFQRTADFTVALWVKTETTGENPLLHLYHGTTNDFEISLRIDGTIDTFVYSGANVLWSENRGYIPPGIWQHIIFSYSSKIASLFINGENIHSAYPLGGIDLKNLNQSFLCMGHSFGTDKYFDGSIDEIKFFNYGLSIVEAKALYDSYKFQEEIEFKPVIIENIITNFEKFKTWEKIYNFQSGGIDFYLPLNAYINDGETIFVLKIYDSSGKHIFGKWFKKESDGVKWQFLNDSGDLIPPGFYLARIHGRDKIYQERMIIYTGK